VEIGTDFTAQKFTNANYAGQILAIGKALEVIEFQMDGTVLNANENFLPAMGYTPDEIRDNHHSLLVDEATRHSSRYKDFWAKLNRGEYEAGEFKRIGKGGEKSGSKPPTVPFST
jgi:methyl-accepting chemotaxis protein